jgi:hypothetical protein
VLYRQAPRLKCEDSSAKTEAFIHHRATPEPGAGCNVDPLGEGLMKLFPDGFRLLFAPAAAPPAVKFGLVPGEVPGEAPVVVPFIDDPVVVPLAAVPPVAEFAPAEPLPLCAKARVLESASATASPMLLSFMMIFPLQ